MGREDSREGSRNALFSAEWSEHLEAAVPKLPSVGALLRVIPSRAMDLELSSPTFWILLKGGRGGWDRRL